MPIDLYFVKLHIILIIIILIKVVLLFKTSSGLDFDRNGLGSIYFPQILRKLLHHPDELEVCSHWTALRSELDHESKQVKADVQTHAPPLTVTAATSYVQALHFVHVIQNLSSEISFPLRHCPS